MATVAFDDSSLLYSYSKLRLGRMGPCSRRKSTMEQDLPEPFLPHRTTDKMNPNELVEYYKKIYASLDTDIQRTVLAQHAHDLAASTSDCVTELQLAKTSPLYSLCRSMSHVAKSCIFTFLTNPTAPLTDSWNWTYAVFAYTIIYAGLWLAEVVLVLMHLFGIMKLMRICGVRWGHGLSPVSWADPAMYFNQQHLFQAATPNFASPWTPAPISGLVTNRPTVRQPLEFNVDVAMAVLLMASLVYERESYWVHKAGEYPAEAEMFLVRSEEMMYRYAKQWDLEFVSISDFQTVRGPFVGAFYKIPVDTRQMPFIVIVVKGTSPDSLAEWITDATFNLESSADWLGAGFAHQGFYTSLFPSPSSPFKMLPYSRILSTIHLIADRAFEKTGNPTNLWIGGHSLGAGIASLLYARLLERPDDLGDHVTLRDAYLYGTPRACSSELVSRIEYNLRKSHNRGRTMWRVANRDQSRKIGDVVTRIPPGLADSRSERSGLRTASFLSYGHVGIPIDLKPHSAPPFYSVASADVGYEVHVVKAQPQPEHEFAAFEAHTSLGWPVTPIEWMDCFLRNVMPILYDHFPGSYFASLCHVRADIQRQPLQLAARILTSTPTPNHQSLPLESHEGSNSSLA